MLGRFSSVPRAVEGGRGCAILGRAFGCTGAGRAGRETRLDEWSNQQRSPNLQWPVSCMYLQGSGIDPKGE